MRWGGRSASAESGPDELALGDARSGMPPSVSAGDLAAPTAKRSLGGDLPPSVSSGDLAAPPAKRAKLDHVVSAGDLTAGTLSAGDLAADDLLSAAPLSAAAAPPCSAARPPVAPLAPPLSRLDLPPPAAVATVTPSGEAPQAPTPASLA